MVATISPADRFPASPSVWRWQAILDRRPLSRLLGPHQQPAPDTAHPGQIEALGDLRDERRNE